MTGTTQPIAPPNSSQETRVFGMVMIEQRRVIERMLGQAGYQRALSRLSEERRSEYTTLGMFSWCRTSTVAAFMIEGAREAELDPSEFTARVVREGFGRVMRTVWRLFMSFSSDEAIVRRAATVYTKAIDRGRAVASVEAPGHLVLEISDWPDIHALDIVAMASGIEAALEVAGRKVQVVYKKLPSQVVRFDVRTLSMAQP